nr:MAG TPA: hypothetical protein [Caudoviricetes sp.]
MLISYQVENLPQVRKLLQEEQEMHPLLHIIIKLVLHII